MALLGTQIAIPLVAEPFLAVSIACIAKEIGAQISPLGLLEYRSELTRRFSGAPSTADADLVGKWWNRGKDVRCRGSIP